MRYTTNYNLLSFEKNNFCLFLEEIKLEGKPCEVWSGRGSAKNERAGACLESSYFFV